MKKNDEDYKNWLTVIRKWLKHNIAFSVMIALIGIIISTYQFYVEDYLKPKRAFLELMKETLSDARNKAVVISDLCTGYKNAADKDNLIQEIKKFNIERLEIISKSITRKLGDKHYSPSSISLIRKFIQMNYSDFLFISFNGRCPDNMVKSEEIAKMGEEIQKSIEQDMGWH